MRLNISLLFIKFGQRAIFVRACKECGCYSIILSINIYGCATDTVAQIAEIPQLVVDSFGHYLTRIIGPKGNIYLMKASIRKRHVAYTDYTNIINTCYF